MHALSRSLLMLALAMGGCTATAPPSALLSPQGQGSAAPTSPSSTTPSAQPLDPTVDMGFRTELVPRQPCLGQPVTLVGHAFAGVSRVKVWLEGQHPRAEGDFFESGASPGPERLLLGEAQVDQAGTFRFEFTLQPLMGPTIGGQQILTRQGDTVSLQLETDTPRQFPLTLYVPLAGNDGTSVCSDAPSPSVSPATLQVEPASFCLGDQVQVTGAGFSGTSVRLTFHRTEDRHGIGPIAHVDVPVAADGTVSYRLDGNVLQSAGRGPVFAEEGQHTLWAYDEAHGRRVDVPLAVCAPGLMDAVQARSIEMTPGVQGLIEGRWDAPRSPHSTPTPWKLVEATAVIRSEAELSAFASREGLSPEVVALLPRVDFARQVGLMVLGTFRSYADVEIVAVEETPAGQVVRSVYWESFGPGGPPMRLFHYRAIAKTDHPIRFAPVAHGYYRHRDSLLPDRRHVRYPLIRVHDPARPPILESPFPR